VVLVNLPKNKINKILFIIYFSNLSIAILTVYFSSSAGYHTSIYNYLPWWGWVSITNVWIISGLVVLFSDFELLKLSTIGITTVLLLFLPSMLVDGIIYGPDSYHKAGAAKAIVLTGNIDYNIYMMFQTTSAVSSIVTAMKIWEPIVVILGFFSPFGLVYLAKSMLNSIGGKFTSPVMLSPILPLGMGIWIKTRSIYHSHHLSFVIAVLFLGAVWRTYQNRTYRHQFLSLILGMVLSFYHPFLFLFSIFTLIILGTHRYASGSLNNHTGDYQISSYYLLIAPLVIYFIFLVGLPFMSDPILGLIGITEINVGVPGEGICISKTEAICGTSFFQYLPIYVIFGVTTGVFLPVILTIVVGSKYNITSIRFAPAILYSVFIFSNVLRAAGIGGSLLTTRFFGFSSIFLLLVISWSEQKCGVLQEFFNSRRVMAIFYIGSLIVLVIGLFSREIVSREFALIVSVSAIISSLYVFVLRHRSWRLQGKIGFLILIVLAISLPLIYPFLGLNGNPNLGGTLAEGQAVEFYDDHRSARTNIATRPRLWGIHMYQNPLSDKDAYKSSSWYLSGILIPDNSIQHQIYLGPGGGPSDEYPHYILTSGITRDYTRAVYTKNNTTYNVIDSVSSEDIYNEYPHAQKIYTATNQTTIYRVNIYQS
jgi:hypothetical protein